jgi:hypothetical protein
MTLDPQTLAAERAVIGAALLWPDRAREATIAPSARDCALIGGLL